MRQTPPLIDNYCFYSTKPIINKFVCIRIIFDFNCFGCQRRPIWRWINTKMIFKGLACDEKTFLLYSINFTSFHRKNNIWIGFVPFRKYFLYEWKFFFLPFFCGIIHWIQFSPLTLHPRTHSDKDNQFSG
jgi:hypothetical protein